MPASGIAGVDTSLTLIAAWESACAGKDKFPSENAALAFLKEMHRGKIRRIRTSDWNELNAYSCRFCSNWHIGHP
jgi:hypothetical protein